MKYVLDSCVAMKWVLPEPDTPKAVRVRTESRKKTHAGELLGGLPYALTGEGPPLVVLPGLARDSGGRGERGRARETIPYRGLATVTRRTVYVVYRPRVCAAAPRWRSWPRLISRDCAVAFQ